MHSNPSYPSCTLTIHSVVYKGMVMVVTSINTTLLYGVYVVLVKTSVPQETPGEYAFIVIHF